MYEKTPDKFLGGNGHDFPPVFVFVIPPLEADHSIFEFKNPIV